MAISSKDQRRIIVETWNIQFLVLSIGNNTFQQNGAHFARPILKILETGNFVKKNSYAELDLTGWPCPLLFLSSSMKWRKSTGKVAFLPFLFLNWKYSNLQCKNMTVLHALIISLLPIILAFLFSLRANIGRDVGSTGRTLQIHHFGFVFLSLVKSEENHCASSTKI